ncbi:MAG: flavodoxin domain-containing protein [Candidatus Izemoplasmatales bacterium]
MKILIIYDTVFGNTQKIAEAIADGFAAAKAECRLVHAGDVAADDVAAADLVLVGSPTRAFQATPTTMKTLKNPALPLSGRRSAAFDTRLDPAEIRSGFFRGVVNTFGFAADRIEKALQKRGAVLIAPAQAFFVIGDQGTVLRKGETDGAFDWARTLLAAAGGN